MRRSLLPALLLVVGLATAGLPGPDSASAASIVDVSPVEGTPHVLDGRVSSVVRVGDLIFLGGDFSAARNQGSSVVMSRSGLLAFDANTGLIDESFAPEPDGEVAVLLPAEDGESLYVGGEFSHVGGSDRDSVALLRIADGSVVEGFDAGAVNGKVNDLRLARGRLWVAGKFRRIAGERQAALATLRPDTGDFDPYMRAKITGTHNGGRTSVLKIDAAPTARALIGLGNFRRVDGKRRQQLFKLKLPKDGAALADFRTRFFEAPCNKPFYFYLRDLDTAPDGSFFVVSTTGGRGGPGSPCDTTSRFEMAASGSNVRPTWINHSGGDTTYALEVADSVVYAGGHARWANNPLGRNSAGPGAVSRPGIAALNPKNGLPYTWNPTRTRGVGVFDFLLDPGGLWVASDTTQIAGVERSRIALLPDRGMVLPSFEPPGALEEVFIGGPRGRLTDPAALFRVNAGGPKQPAASGVRWSPDTKARPSPLHNAGNRRADRPAVAGVAADVPPGTPQSVFSTSLRTRLSQRRQTWQFSAPKGAPLQIRLYFAAPCACDAREPVLRIKLDGATVLRRLALRDAHGPETGFMRSFDIVSDGRVDVALLALRDYAAVSAVEVIRTDLPPAPTSGLLKRPLTSAGYGAVEEVPSGDVNWSSVKGAFMLDGRLYTATSQQGFTRRPFDGHTFVDDVTPVNTADLLTPLRSWQNDISTMTSLFYDDGRVYYTLAGRDRLFYRYFEPESDVVGALRHTAALSRKRLSFSSVKGMFRVGGRVYWATSTGELRSSRWRHGAAFGAPAGPVRVDSGPATDSLLWTARTVFALDLS